MMKHILKSLLFSLMLTGTAFAQDFCQHDSVKELIKELIKEQTSDDELKQVRCENGEIIFDYETNIPEFNELNAQEKQEAQDYLQNELQQFICKDAPIQKLHNNHLSIIYNFKMDEQHQFSVQVNKTSCPEK